MQSHEMKAQPDITSRFQKLSRLDDAAFGKLLSKAGRQRMLSQRAGLLLTNIAFRQELKSVEKDRHISRLISTLELTVGDFTKAHLELSEYANNNLDQLSLKHAFEQGQPTRANTIGVFCKKLDATLAGLKNGTQLNKLECMEFADFIIDELIVVLQDIVNCLDADFEKFIRKNADKEVMRRQNVTKAVGKIKTAAHQSNMIAFNAKIAAARAGEFGDEFGALTDEIKCMSDWIKQSSEEIIASVED